MMIGRRRFLAGMGASAVFTPSVAAEVQCNYPDYYGYQTCTAGIPSVRFYSALQECPQWCWAACIQMIFATAGRIVRQTDIVESVYPRLDCYPANGPQIVAGVNNTVWRDSNGRQFRANARPLADLHFMSPNPGAVAAAAQELAAGKPLINGALGHATVLSAMTYVRDMYGNGQPVELIVRDPWPGNQHRRTLSAQEYFGTSLLVAIDVG